jgi:hypothetical protein
VWEQSKSKQAAMAVKPNQNAVDFSKYAEQGPDKQIRLGQIICEETFGLLQMVDNDSSSL